MKSIKEVILENGFETIYGNDLNISDYQINSPLLFFATGHDDLEGQTVVIGKKEEAYLNSISVIEANQKKEALINIKPALIILTLGVTMEFPKGNVAIAKSNKVFEETVYKLYCYYSELCNEPITVHGTLVSIYGIGTLIIGRSGIGKSEAALDLIKRGHSLISDDLVELLIDDNHLIGRAPLKLKEFLEIRGIGIVNVCHTFGIGAFSLNSKIDIVVSLEENPDTITDRLGLNKNSINYLGFDVKKVIIPVLPGRSMSLLIESAALKEKSIRLGYDGTTEFIKNLGGNKND